MLPWKHCVKVRWLRLPLRGMRRGLQNWTWQPTLHQTHSFTDFTRANQAQFINEQTYIHSLVICSNSTSHRASNPTMWLGFCEILLHTMEGNVMFHTELFAIPFLKRGNQASKPYNSNIRYWHPGIWHLFRLFIPRTCTKVPNTACSISNVC